MSAKKLGFFVMKGFFDDSFIQDCLDRFLYLAIVFNASRGIQHIQYKDFVSMARVSRNSVAASLKRLKAAGWIEYQRGRGKVNRFRFFSSPASALRGKVKDAAFSKVEVSRSMIEDFLGDGQPFLGKDGKIYKKKLSYRAKVTLAVAIPNIASNSHYKRGPVSFGPSVSRVAKVVGKSQRTARRYLDSLNEQKVVKRIRRKKQLNKYIYIRVQERTKKEKRKGGKKERSRVLFEKHRVATQEKHYTMSPEKKSCNSIKPCNAETSEFLRYFGDNNNEPYPTERLDEMLSNLKEKRAQYDSKPRVITLFKK